jgi:exopolyphosphatase/guanosine-5'-triphosphate,3'-diphosphate pyrophosphatase
MKIIVDSQRLPFSDNQRRMVALIARYHRKALPKDSHPLFSQLSDKDKQKTRILAGILRIADGLDRTHTCAVKSVECDLSGNDIVVGYKVCCPSPLEMEAAYEKSDLLRQALGRNIRLVVM